MTISNLTRLTCLLALLFATSLQAQEETAVSSETKVAGTDPVTIDDSTEKRETETEQNEPRPQGDNLKNRNLGAAFKTFRPSEEISADNAVPFPVDI